MNRFPIENWKNENTPAVQEILDYFKTWRLFKTIES